MNSADHKAPVIIGYYSQWSIYSPNIHIRDLPTHLMTHLVYKSADLTKDGEVILGDSYADIEFLYPGADRNDRFLGSFGQLEKVKKRQPELKSIISIGGWGRSEHFSTMAASPSGRAKLAKSAIQFMKKYQFDGIEIDWQFPIYRASSKSITSYRKADGKHLNLLLEEIKRQCKQMNIDCWLQAVLAPYSLENSWDATLLSDNADVIVVDVTRLPGDIGELAEPQSALYAAQGERSVDSVVSTLTGYGIELKKIVISIASFAVGWEGVPAKNNGFKQPHQTLSWGSWDSKSSGATGIYNQKNLTHFLATGEYRHYWDEIGKTNYVYNPNKYGGHFITYEGYQAIAAKADYVKENHLAGVAIIQLHHGDAALFNVFDQFHFLKSRYYKLLQFWHENSGALLVLFQMLAVILIGIVLFVFWQNKKNNELYQQKQQFNRLQYWMQSIEWPLLNVVSLAKNAQERALLSSGQVESFAKLSSEVLRPISSIISETKLNSSVNQVFKEVVELQQIIQNVATLIELENNKRLTWNKNINTRLLVNPDRFQQFLFYLCDYVIHQTNANDNISLDITAEEQSIQLNVELLVNADTNQVSHTRLNTLFHQAKLLDLAISLDRGKGLLSVLINNDVIVNDEQHNSFLAFKFDQRCLHSSTGHSMEATVEQQALNSEMVSRESSAPIEEYSSLFAAITSFNMSAAPSKDIYKGLEQACQYFIDILKQEAKVQVFHHEQFVTKLGKESLTSQHEIIINSDDVTVEVITQEKLSEAEQQLIQVLVYQTLMVQKAIQSLLKEPSILAELYELTRYKDRIKYLKAESGYTGLYIQSLKEPRYISMRLRAIKQYFDDVALVQVHRSYLVNPKKVSKIKTIAKLKFELELGSVKIPVSRTYVPMLKEHFPQWFS
ncbi:glycosyl hydrolase family 18 protein [Thalassotalea sp. 1_MG-2023]|uniref:glycosyl hydrolase family 18 protein n=1 Tax=Thalassotalea sp. 1_MG-2023 TaxID=3062680 RepID=UPI0026E270D4|nr:glycosyl hydrolase family 18 protein [Thalassotalea sp. 1_MG-2023]MDO6427270.1 glycosyl hydrolase family 18 protein [Thalassotalea sp. 1_MG-2023]